MRSIVLRVTQFVAVLTVIAILLPACSQSAAAPTPAGAVAKPADIKPAAPPQAAPASQAAGQFDGTITIGVLNSLSGAGAAYGPRFKASYEIGVEDVNAQGGIAIGGKKYKLALDQQDTGSKPEQALAMLRKFSEENKYLMVVGPTMSTEAQAVFASLQKKLDDPSDTGSQIVVFCPAAALAGLAKLSAWFFRNVFDEAKLIDDTVGTFKKALNLKTVSVMVGRDDTKTYQTWTDQIKPSLEKAGYQIVDVEEVMGKDTNVSAQISKLKSANADLWVSSILSITAPTVLQEAARQQFKPKVRLAMMSALGAELISLDSQLKEGLFVTNGYNLDDPKYTGLAGQIKAKGIDGLQTGAQIGAVDGVLMMKSVLEQAGLSLKPEDVAKDRRKIRDTYAKISNWKGLAGDVYSMRQDHDVDRGGVIIEIKGGKLITWQGGAQ